MSNPTSNFGWQMPTATDLVTDLPADFEVFGQAVDTSLADLKGGTTGQILSKNSNTDMDFIWTAAAPGDITGVTAGTGISGGGTSGTVTVTNDMATTITASGDIVIGTGSGTYDNLPIGTTGQILTADTTVSPYKVKWATAGASAQDFALINSGGTALTGSGTTTISFSGKNQLFIRVLSASAVGTYCTLWVRFNSDTGANYGYTVAVGSGSAGTSWQGFERGTADNELQLGFSGDNAANSISADILVSGTNATGYKPISLSSYATGTGARMRTGEGFYSGTSALTSVSIISSGQNFDAGTVFVYGA